MGFVLLATFSFFLLNSRAVFTQATSSHAEARSQEAEPAARTRTNRIGRALRVATPPAEYFSTFESHPTGIVYPIEYSPARFFLIKCICVQFKIPLSIPQKEL